MQKFGLINQLIIFMAQKFLKLTAKQKHIIIAFIIAFIAGKQLDVQTLQLILSWLF